MNLDTQDSDTQNEITDGSSVRAAIEAASDELGIENFENETEITNEPEDSDGDSDEEKSLDGPERDEQGRFKAKTATEATSAEPQGEKSKEEPKEPDNSPIMPPPSMTAEEKEAFAKLPREAQEYVSRYSESQRKYLTTQTQSLAERGRQVEAIEQAVAPYNQTLQRLGKTPDQFLANALGWQAEMDRNPVGAITGLLRSYGLTPQKFAEAAGTGAVSAPQPAAVNPYNQQLAQRVNYLESQRVQEQTRALQEKVLAEIERFRTETDEQGNALRPHFQAVEHELSAELPLIFEQNPGISEQEALAKAYEVAVYRNPATRELWQRDELARREAERRAKEKEKLDRARSASSSVKGASTSGARVESPRSIRGALEAAAQEVGF